MIIHATIYDEKGQITSNISALENEIDILIQDQPYILGYYDTSEYYISGELPIPFPLKPNEYSSWSWDTMEWIDNYAHADMLAKKKRNELLLECDWTQLPDVPQDIKSQWVQYRQDLRDITLQEGYPFNISYPIAP